MVKSEGTKKFEKAQKALEDYAGKDEAELRKLNDAVHEAAKGASRAARGRWW